MFRLDYRYFSPGLHPDLSIKTLLRRIKHRNGRVFHSDAQRKILRFWRNSGMNHLPPRPARTAQQNRPSGPRRSSAAPRQTQGESWSFDPRLILFHVAKFHNRRQGCENLFRREFINLTWRFRASWQTGSDPKRWLDKREEAETGLQTQISFQLGIFNKSLQTNRVFYG